MTKIFVLQHVHSMDDGAEDVKFIGVYSSRENADAAITRLSQAPGFSETPDGFHIDEYQVDKDQWVEGFSRGVLKPFKHLYEGSSMSRQKKRSFIYFASNALACVRDTRDLARRHGLIWRSMYTTICNLQPGDPFLLAFSVGNQGDFVPLLRLLARALDPGRGEQPCGAGPCYCVIPAQIQQNFVGAVAGDGGSGAGYDPADNPHYTAICVEKLEANDAVDQIWQGVGQGPDDLPPVQNRYGWGSMTRPALRIFNAQHLAPRILPANMRP